MDKYAVIQLGGKQLMVSAGDIFEIERQSKLNIDVLMFSDGKNIKIGTPFLKDITVKASILSEKLDKKVVVARYKSKSRYRKKKGHRQPISVVKIEEISSGKVAKKKTEPKKSVTAKTVKKPVKKTAVSKTKATVKKTVKKGAKK